MPRSPSHLSQPHNAFRKVPTALADHVEKNNLQGKLKYSLFVGASSGAETENRWARLDMIERRSPHQVGKEIARGINEGRIHFFDKHLSMFPVDLMYVSTDQWNWAGTFAKNLRAITRKTSQTRSWTSSSSRLQLSRKTEASYAYRRDLAQHLT